MPAMASPEVGTIFPTSGRERAAGGARREGPTAGQFRAMGAGRVAQSGSGRALRP